MMDRQFVGVTLLVFILGITAGIPLARYATPENDRALYRALFNPSPARQTLQTRGTALAVPIGPGDELNITCRGPVLDGVKVSGGSVGISLPRGSSLCATNTTINAPTPLEIRP